MDENEASHGAEDGFSEPLNDAPDMRQRDERSEEWGSVADQAGDDEMRRVHQVEMELRG